MALELLSLCVATHAQEARANSEAGPKGVGQDARSKEKVTKEKGHRAFAPRGHPARKVRGRAAGFVDSPSGNCSCVASTRASMPSPWTDAKLAGIPAGHPAG
ncbi:hypothetical protein GCM10009126_10850 [Rhodanobacter caeni]|uniref:Secreted protein n=1 Tax=Rhodanobacter caeni TaxID=657654 RepID=A0ABN0UDN2_9GAMM